MAREVCAYNKLLTHQVKKSIKSCIHTFVTVPHLLLSNTFKKNWHPIRIEWVMGMKYSTGNFLNGSNNRLESINAKLKSVISRYSSLEEFTDKFFLILRVLRNERDHKAALVAQKVPVVYNSHHDTTIANYVHLTPYCIRP